MARVVGIDPSFTGCGVSDGTRHIIISTKPGPEDEHPVFHIRRRIREICEGVRDFIGDGADAIFIEAPMLATPAHGGSHLYDLGFLMNDLLRLCECYAEVTLVPILAVKKFASGKGNTKKDEMKLAVYKRWAVEFEKDPGADKLHAFVLCKLGESVLRGEAAVAPIKRRGKGQRKAA